TEHRGPAPSHRAAEPGGADEASVTRHEEQLRPAVEEREAGRVRVRKYVESQPVEEVVPRRVEHGDAAERRPAEAGDSGEVEMLDDGSVSIPIFEEELVVTKRLVVRERMIVRKTTVIDEHRLQTELRRERVEVETEGDVDVATPGDRGSGTS
ncbi:MAG: YsnF/AvaK domain-containing protein, partial [Actinomycetota bacterium]|nr:YsnF/AvaK domain-containing protein [Actinomycetota bacterium]